MPQDVAQKPEYYFTLAKRCSTCKWWNPKYSGVGECYREGRMHAKFWCSNAKDSALLTVASFCCIEHEEIPLDIQKDVV